MHLPIVRDLSKFSLSLPQNQLFVRNNAFQQYNYWVLKNSLAVFITHNENNVF